MVYQEQVMQIVNRLGGVPLGRAYGLIKAISKKKNEVIEAERGPFIDGAVTQGVGRETAEQIFDLIVRFGGYGFNKSHSAGYAMLAYKTAYLKAYYPSEYMAALLSLESGNAEKVSKYFEEAKRMGIAVLPPDVNSSEVEFAVVPDGIRFGLNAVKGVGEKAAEAVVRAREKLGRFGSIFEFASNVDLRLLNKGVLEALVSCGAFDSLGAGRSALFEAVPRAVAFGAGSQRDRSSGQGMLFGAAVSEPELAELPEWSERELLEREKQALGFHVSRSPLDAFR
jgi:DNA polymerase-3 subunit alpha